MSAANVIPIDPFHAQKNDLANRVKAGLSKTVEGVFEAGTALIEAKATLFHGEFLQFLKIQCGISARTAQMLMKIAEHPILVNANHGSLPTSWRTLYELGRWEDLELRHALSNHWINGFAKYCGSKGRNRRSATESWPLWALKHSVLARPAPPAVGLVGTPGPRIGTWA